METRHKDLLTKNLTALCDAMSSVDNLLPYALEEKLFSRTMIEDYKDPKMNVVDCKVNFIMDIQKRGPKAFDKFVSCLVKSGNYNAARILKPDLDLPMNEPINTYRQNEKSILKPIGEIVVKSAQVYDNGQLEKDVYKMRSRPRGIALIFANTDFLNPKYNKRHGCHEDLRLLKGLFNGLGYQVIAYEDKTYDEVLQIINGLISRPELSEVHSFIMAVSSHGEEEGFVCTDGIICPISVILERFNNKNCQFLMHKPKIFFVQACRGSQFDKGAVSSPHLRVPVESSSIESDSRAHGSPQQDRPRSPIHSRVSTNTDMIIVYATQPGLVSFRDQRRGSWLYQVVTRVFMENAWKDHLKKMLQEVMREVNQLKADGMGGAKQPMELVDKVFSYDMYFNPGLP